MAVWQASTGKTTCAASASFDDASQPFDFMRALCVAPRLAWPRYAASWSTDLLMIWRRHMADLFFLMLGGGALVVFAVLAAALKKV